MTFRVRRLESVVVAAAEPEEAARAWQETLGMERAPDGETASPRLQVGTAFLEIAATVEGEREGLRALVIEVERFEEAIAHLCSKGVAVSEVAADAGRRRSAWIDPRSSHGVPICLVEQGDGTGERWIGSTGSAS
ncbi:MAG: hypothetical protein ABR978_01560 [Dehalococcoidia bacterium]|jgi:hypothetical protein